MAIAEVEKMIENNNNPVVLKHLLLDIIEKKPENIPAYVQRKAKNKKVNNK